MSGLLLSVLVGFAPTYFLPAGFPERQHLAPPEPFFAVHGAVCTVWILLQVVQPLLVRAGRRRWHRWLGAAGVAVAVGVAGTGVWGALLASVRPGGFMGPPFPPEAFLFVPLLDALQFALLVGLGIAAVRRPQAHKRLMLLATLAMSQAALVRIQPLGVWSGPVMQLGLTLLFVVGLALWDRRATGRMHPVTLCIGFPLFASEFLRFPVALSPPWRACGRALVEATMGVAL